VLPAGAVQHLKALQNASFASVSARPDDTMDSTVLPTGGLTETNGSGVSTQEPSTKAKENPIIVFMMVLPCESRSVIHAGEGTLVLIVQGVRFVSGLDLLNSFNNVV
jgi:hypothetical protein